jgi:hypothetical protein
MGRPLSWRDAALCVVAAAWLLGGNPAHAEEVAPEPSQEVDGRPTETPADTARQGEVRLRLLEAQLHLLTGRLGDARTAYERLRADLPESADPLVGLGTVAHQTDRLRLAQSMYREALLLDPANPSLAASLAAIERDTGPRLRADIEQRFQRGGIGSSSADITVGEVGGHWNIGDAWRIGAIQGVAHVNASQVQRADGAVTDFTGDRIRTEVFVRHEWTEGASLTASVFANEWSGGAGLLGRLPDDTGQTTLRAEYRRPIWDFVEAIIDGATRDRLAAERFQRFSPRVTGRIEVGVNRYGIPRDNDDLLRSATVRGDLRLARIGGIAGLSLAYALDAEYVLSQDRPLNAAGQPYQPLPIVDREVHAGLIGYGGSHGTPDGDGRLTYQVTVGYGVDRYGRSGPVAFGSVGYAVGAFEVLLRAGYVRNIGRSEGETTTLGAALAWVF